MATSVGRPDGLMRFEADIPACPIAFDVLDGAVLVPAQITACVFKAADCQTTPGGLWGPDGALARRRRGQDRQGTRRGGKGDGQDRARDRGSRQGQPARRPTWSRDQNAFAGQRDELCHDYAKESLHGYCALRVTQARTALLQTRLDALAAAATPATASEKGKKGKSKKGTKQP